MAKPFKLDIQNIERLEFSGKRRKNGTLKAFGVVLEDWPEELSIAGKVWELEESQNLNDGDELAYYTLK